MSKSDVRPTLRAAERLCRQRGVRLTAQRRMVLRLLCEANSPLSAYDILERMGAGLNRPAPPTVYRALDFLQAQGLVHKLESLHAFVGCNHPGELHSGQFLICTDCGAVDEMENQAIAESLACAEQAQGFKTKRPVVELLGTCASCNRD